MVQVCEVSTRAHEGCAEEFVKCETSKGSSRGRVAQGVVISSESKRGVGSHTVLDPI
jgi:hypothetical protein